MWCGAALSAHSDAGCAHLAQKLYTLSASLETGPLRGADGGGRGAFRIMKEHTAFVEKEAGANTLRSASARRKRIFPPAPLGDGVDPAEADRLVQAAEDLDVGDHAAVLRAPCHGNREHVRTQ